MLNYDYLNRKEIGINLASIMQQVLSFLIKDDYNVSRVAPQHTYVFGFVFFFCFRKLDYDVRIVGRCFFRYYIILVRLTD